MPHEESQNTFFISPSKRGLKGLVSMNIKDASCTSIEECFNDHDLAHRKAEEAGNSIYTFFLYINHYMPCHIHNFYLFHL